MTQRAQQRTTEIDIKLISLANRGAWSGGPGTATITLVIGSAAGAVDHRGLTGALVTVLGLTPLAMIEPFAELIPATRQWPQLQLAAGTIKTIADDDIAESSRPIEHIPSIDLVDVAARWPGMSTDIISELNLHANRADCITIVGPSGIGRSTLFSVAIGFLPPRSGRLSFYGNQPLGRHTHVA